MKRIIVLLLTLAPMLTIGQSITTKSPFSGTTVQAVASVNRATSSTADDQPLPPSALDDKPQLRLLTVGIVEDCQLGKVVASARYANAVERAGMAPMVIPLMRDSALLAQAVAMVDMVMLTGGEDIDPQRFGEKASPKLGSVNSVRDSFEYRVLDEAVAQHKPIIGICRGMQVINVYFGGTLYQDLPSQHAKPLLNHKQPKRKGEPVHDIVVEKNSHLYAALQRDTIGVNSNHHQAVKELAPGFRTVAQTADGVVEAIEARDYPCVAWQFHPECLCVGDDTVFIRMFQQLVLLGKK